MHAPTPDPNNQPSAENADGASSSEPTRKGSTGSHRNVELPLSDVLRSHSSSVRGHNAAEMVAHIPLPISTDDAPTVITKDGKSISNAPAASPPPPVPYVVGESHSIAGRKLGHFELIEAIGAGGMAAVLKARDLELGRIVALKILPPESALDPENVTRFKQEGRAAAKLDHDNVARVYFCGEDQGLHFIAFEFVEGITLRQTIDWRGPLSPGDCVRFMIQIAAGLAHAAERGVVHRDIKPSNILITPDGRAKIVDMGLARHLESQSVNGGVTHSGVTLGTFDYISPEQALDPRVADVRSDIYSMGCTFYHAVTGRPPVGEGTAAKKLHDHQHVDPLDPRELNPKLPDELAAVLARMMAKDPTRRYQTPAELIAHLKAIAERLHISLDAMATDATVQAVMADDRVLPRVPRLRLGWVAAAAAVVAAVVAIVVAANGPDLGSKLPSWASGQTPQKPDVPLDPGTKPTTPAIPADGRLVSNLEELAAALADAKTTKLRLAPGDYDLTKLAKPIAFQGTQLDLIGSATSPPVVHLAASSKGLTLSAATVNVHGIRFEIASPAEVELTGDLTGLAILDAAKIDFEDCSFFPDDAARKAGVVAVGIGGPPSETASIHLNRCLFAPGGIGLRVPSHSNVVVNDSGFAPQFSAIQIREDANADEMPSTTGATAIRLEKSTFMLDAFSAAVEVDTSAILNVHVTSGYSVFAPANGAAPEAKLDAPTQGVIIRNAARKRTAKLTAIAGQKNAWYSVLATGGSSKPSAFDDAALWVKLNQRPWDATGGVLNAFEAQDPWSAFRLTLSGPNATEAIFVKGNLPHLIGAQFHDQQHNNIRRVYGNSVAVWPPPAPQPIEITSRIWWPNAPEDTMFRPKQEYRDLASLLRDARSGDTILIRHNGPLEMDQYVIQPSSKKVTGADRGDYHLTFKPETKDHKPILTLAKSSFLDRSLFQILEGRVSFEGLHFELKPGSDQEKLAAVTLVAGRGCEFLNCTFTLDEADKQITTVVAINDAASLMKMEGPPSRSVPAVKFTGCLVRGKGRAVSVPVSRQFRLEIVQSVIGLNGPVVYAKAGGRDPGITEDSTIHLSRVTALLGGPLVALQGGSFGAMKSGLVATTITADHCLFAAVPGAGMPMVEVKDAEFDRMDTKSVLKWTSPEPNRFANFDSSLPVVIVKPSDASSTQNWKWNEWFQFDREKGAPMGKVVFVDEPDDLSDLSNLKPGNVKVKSVELPDMPNAEPGDAGADPEKVANPPEVKKDNAPGEM